MRKKIFISIILISVFFMACSTGNSISFQNDNASEHAVSGVAVSGVAVSGGAVSSAATATQSIQARDVKHEMWEVTDICGERKSLDVANIPELDTCVVPTFMNDPSEYAQVYDGHYYYMRRKKGVYTIFQDEGEKIGSFVSESYEITGCAKHGDYFWVIYHDSEVIGSKNKLGVVNFEQGLIEFRCTIDSNIVWISDNHIYIDYHYTNNREKVVKSNLNGDELKVFMLGESRGYCEPDDENLYYIKDRFEKENIKYTYINQETNDEMTVFEYRRDKEKLPDEFSSASGIFKHNGDVIIRETYRKNTSGYFILFVIDKKSKRMIKVSDYMKYYAINKKYIFYTDKKNRIHRWNRKNGNDTVISNIRGGELHCANDKLFVQTFYDELGFMLESIDEVNSDVIYVMDFDGGNIKKIGL